MSWELYTLFECSCSVNTEHISLLNKHFINQQTNHYLAVNRSFVTTPLIHLKQAATSLSAIMECLMCINVIAMLEYAGASMKMEKKNLVQDKREITSNVINWCPANQCQVCWWINLSQYSFILYIHSVSQNIINYNWPPNSIISIISQTTIDFLLEFERGLVDYILNSRVHCSW